MIKKSKVLMLHVLTFVHVLGVGCDMCVQGAAVVGRLIITSVPMQKAQ